MANTLRNQRIIDNNKRCLTKIVIVSDGTEEANTIIVDVSTLSGALNTNNYIMVSNTHPLTTYRSTVKRVAGVASGNSTHGRVQWHGDANSEIVTFGPGRFEYDFHSMGDGAVITNPEANSVGDILLSTSGLNSGDTLTLFVDIRKDARDYDAGQTADPTSFNRGPAAGF